MPDSGDHQSPGVPAAAVPSAERERIIDALTSHYAEDHLSEADLEARLDRAYAAMTLAELRSVVEDLPALGEDTAPPLPVPVAPGSRLVRAPTRIRALFSGHEQSITGVVPRSMTVRARLGYVELDLTHGTFEPGLTEIDVRALMGYVQLRLPGNVRVEGDGRGLFGNFATRGAGSDDPSDPRVVRITGRALFGYVESFVSGKGAGEPDRGSP